MSLICWRSPLLLALVWATPVGAETVLNETRSSLEKWVEARQLISKAKSDGQMDKETIQQTIQLYERELKLVGEQMSKVSTNSTQVEKERIEAEEIKKSSNEALDRAREFAGDFEGQLKQQIPQLPIPLQEILKPLLIRIPTDRNTRMTVAERMQVIIGILSELDKFNNSVSVFSEKRKNEKGEEVAVESLYVGLAAAYFVNDANDFAGTGVPGPKGWEWTTQSGIAAPVREAVRIYRNERPAKFISLPAVIR